jgi:hypothetical protein
MKKAPILLVGLSFAIVAQAGWLYSDPQVIDEPPVASLVNSSSASSFANTVMDGVHYPIVPPPGPRIFYRPSGT